MKFKSLMFTFLLAVLTSPLQAAPSIEEWFHGPSFSAARLSTDASWIASAIRTDEKAGIRFWNAETLTHVDVLFPWSDIPGSPGEFEWIGPSIGIVEFSGREGQRNLLVELDSKATSEPRVLHRRWLEDPGFIVDTLPEQPSHALFGQTLDTSAEGIGVWKVDFSNPDLHGQLFNKDRIAVHVGDALAWFADASGHVHGIARPRKGGDGWALWSRPANQRKFGEMARFDDEQALFPVALTNDGRTLYLKSSIAGTANTLFRIRMGERVPETVLTHDGGDIHSVITRPADGELIGYRYYEGGILRSRYMDAAGEARQKALEARFQGKQVVVLDQAPGTDVLIALVSSATDAGGFLRVKGKDLDHAEFARIRPPLDKHRMAPVKRFEVKSQDGLDIEAFLTLPEVAGSTRLPLIVLPHGGPFEVFDVLGFNTETQFLASHGFAILQVNYRGSGGRDREFIDAARRQWGRQIENDIELAVEAALREHPIDPSRICSSGSSYGGYSALMLMIRNPERYRCAAAFAAPTDLTLSFLASDWAQDPERRTLMAGWVGDPEKDHKEMREHSPLYLQSRIQGPVLLGHGADDARVSHEHSLRLAWMLKQRDHPVEEWYFRNEGHGLFYVANDVTYQGARLAFLRGNTEPRTPSTP